jgi:hypothetical protein
LSRFVKDALWENIIKHRFQGHHPTELRKVWICFILICADRFKKGPEARLAPRVMRTLRDQVL